MKSIEIEIAVSKFFNYRQNIIVPNISWGLGIHECDLLILTKTGYVWEVEIKVCKYDLKNDRKKSHNHYSEKIKRLYFAIPYDLINEIKYIPDRAGIVIVKRDTVFGVRRCEVIRYPKDNINAIKLNIDDRMKIAHLGTMRIWGLKRKIEAIS
jgi:hypothetical protein